MSLKVALNSVQKDVTLSKGSLVSLHAQPRQAAKKNIYIIGKQILKDHQAYSNIYADIYCYGMIQNLIFIIIIMLIKVDLNASLMKVLGRDLNTFTTLLKCLIFITADGNK